MVVYEIRAPLWPEKTASFTSKEMKKTGSRMRDCRFCVLAEEPLVESKTGLRILKAKYPYIPQHCILAPRDHVLALHKITKKQFDDIFMMTGEMIQNFQHATALWNFGVVGGQTLKHLHIHLICSNVQESKYAQLKSAENLIADPLSLPILVESGLPVIGNGYDTAFSSRIHKNDLYDFTKNTITQLFDGFFHLVQSRMYDKVHKYGYNYHNLERLTWLYGVSADNLNDIDFLISNMVTAGLGINLMISECNKDTFKIHIMPRATSVSPTETLSKRIAGLELFHQTILTRTKLAPDIEIEWEESQGEFYKQAQKLLNHYS
ncbi:MAG: HIT domain-containing protein [Candidatus Micrarchaeota archaeon]|nr:HIT domain-containing protein [Candidatus Micrarchaeota archaeon]